MLKDLFPPLSILLKVKSLTNILLFQRISKTLIDSENTVSHLEQEVAILREKARLKELEQNTQKQKDKPVSGE